MQKAAHRNDEMACLAPLHDLAVLGSAPEAESEAVVRVAVFLCDQAIALISLIDSDRQWFKVLNPGQRLQPSAGPLAHNAGLGSASFWATSARLAVSDSQMNGPAAHRI